MQSSDTWYNIHVFVSVCKGDNMEKLAKGIAIVIIICVVIWMITGILMLVGVNKVRGHVEDDNVIEYME